MAVPVDRISFKALVLQNLGDGVIRIEVSDDQVENWIDFALAKAKDYHFDFVQEVYYKYVLTQTDIDNEWIPMDPTCLGAVEIFDLVSTLMGVGMWNVQYQFVLANMPNWGMLDLSNYWMTMQHLQLLQQWLVGKQPFRYNRYINQLYIDMDWSQMSVGDYLVIKTYNVLDPNTYTKIWADQWLQTYVTQLVKRQWGNNLKKYTGMQLPNGQAMNGQQIYDEAEEAIKELESTLIGSYSIPVAFMIG
jgi:hypothetical protein